MKQPASLASSGTALLTLCTLLAVVAVSRAGFERSCNTSNRASPKGLCGANLSMILSTICRMYNKRGGGTEVMSPEPDSQEVLDEKIFLPKDKALSFFKRELHVRGTITCECCIHQCGMPELRQYCSVAEPLSAKRQSTEREEEGSGEGENDDAYQTELLHIAHKRRIGREILRSAPSWWHSVNVMTSQAESQLDRMTKRSAL